jgi:hypothetical protein
MSWRGSLGIPVRHREPVTCWADRHGGQNMLHNADGRAGSAAPGTALSVSLPSANTRSGTQGWLGSTRGSRTSCVPQSQLKPSTAAGGSCRQVSEGQDPVVTRMVLAHLAMSPVSPAVLHLPPSTQGVGSEAESASLLRPFQPWPLQPQPGPRPLTHWNCNSFHLAPVPGDKYLCWDFTPFPPGQMQA